MTLDMREAGLAQRALVASLLCAATELRRTIERAAKSEPSPQGLDKIRAIRQHQGAQVRYRTACQELADCCRGIRAAVAKQYRGAVHAELRKQWGEGMPCAPGRPRDLLRVADQIAQAQARPEVAELAGVRPRTLQRLARLRQVVAAMPAEIVRRRRAARVARGRNA